MAGATGLLREAREPVPPHLGPWRGHLKSLLPARQRLTRGHHAALPYDGLPAFMAALRTRKSTAALALELAILTATRSGEVATSFGLGRVARFPPGAGPSISR